jgi:IS5 family transposase
MKNSPYDGHTLATTLAAVESITGVAITDAYVDRGYRGHDYTGSAEVHVAGQRHKGCSRSERRRRRRRSAVEPKIRHLKSDHRMDRCFLTGLRGDDINAVLAAAGANMRKLLRRFFYALIRWLEGTLVLPSAHHIALA